MMVMIQIPCEMSQKLRCEASNSKSHNYDSQGSQATTSCTRTNRSEIRIHEANIHVTHFARS